MWKWRILVLSLSFVLLALSGNYFTLFGHLTKSLTNIFLVFNTFKILSNYFTACEHLSSPAFFRISAIQGIAIATLVNICRPRNTATYFKSDSTKLSSRRAKCAGWPKGLKAINVFKWSLQKPLSSVNVYLFCRAVDDFSLPFWRPLYLQVPSWFPSWWWKWKFAASQKTQENSDSSLLQLNQDPVSVLLCWFIKVTNSLDEGGDGFDLFLQLKAVQPAFWWHNSLQVSKLLRSKPKFGQSESKKYFSDSLKPELWSKDWTWFYKEVLKAAPLLAPEVKQLKVEKPQFHFFF